MSPQPRRPYDRRGCIILTGGMPMNVTLIGMPGCGKTTIGRRLAQETGMRFLDVDQAIMAQEGRSLAQIIQEEGDEGFRAVENRVVASLDTDHTVLSTGGSVIYGAEGMAHLREISRVVYLHAAPEVLQHRLRDLRARGVTIHPGQSFLDLYRERTPLYERYADVVVDIEGRNIVQLSRDIRRKLRF